MKIVFATDLHIGASQADFHQQPYWEQGHAALVEALGKLVEREKADELLLGGDMTHVTSAEEIGRFIELFKGFEVGMQVCLGNHDVCVSPEADHMDVWWKALDPHKRFSLAPCALVSDEVDVFTANTRWADETGAARLYWKAGTGPQARITGGDAAWLDDWLGRDRRKPAIVMLHGELDALEPEFTGLPEPIHVPAREYVERVGAVLDRHSRAKLVLGGHNHVTHAVRHGGRVHLTTGSMSEVPFYVRIIEVDKGVIRVRTESLMDAGMAVDEKRRWALGREEDRTLVIG